MAEPYIVSWRGIGHGVILRFYGINSYVLLLIQYIYIYLKWLL